MLTAAAAFTACSNEDIVPAPNGENVQITLNSTTLDASGLSTRAPFEGAIGATNQLTARIIASTATTFMDTHADGTMTFAGAAAGYNAGATGTTTYPVSGPVYLFGLYPATGWASYSEGVANYTFSGKEDVMATSQIPTVAADVAPGGTYKTLTFKHLLTKLEVKMNATSTAIAEFGNVESIRLTKDAAATGINNRVSVNNKTTTMVPSFTSTAAYLDFHSLAVDGTTGAKTYSASPVSSFALTSDSKTVAYAMVAPVNASAATDANEYVLEIKTASGATKTVNIDLKKGVDGSAFTGPTAGYSFGISLYFKSINEIMADVTVETWTNEGEFQGEITNNP